MAEKSDAMKPQDSANCALTPLQRQMLEVGQFHLDGWTSQRGHEAAADLERRGLVTCFDGGSSQYTSLNYTVTEAGRLLVG